MNAPQPTPDWRAAFDELLPLVFADQATPEQQQTFADLLKGNAAAQDEFLACSRTEACLHWYYSPQPAFEPHITVGSSFVRRGWETFYGVASDYVALSLLISAIVMAIIVLSMGLIVPTKNPLTPDGPSIAFVAEITTTDVATWDKTSDGNHQNRSLFSGEKLVLNSGVAEVKFANGTTVVLEGPATLVVSSGKSGRLTIGNLTAKVPQRAIGFTVQTSSADFVDLGTEFGVSVGAAGAELHVFSGKVAVRPSGENIDLQIVNASEAILVTSTNDGPFVKQQDYSLAKFPRVAEAARLRQYSDALPIRHDLKLWLDASDIDGDGAREGFDEEGLAKNLVQLWRDKSGSGNDAKKDTAPLLAIGAGPNRTDAVRWNGRGRLLVDDFAISGDVTIVAVFEADVVDSNEVVFGAAGGSGNYFVGVQVGAVHGRVFNGQENVGRLSSAIAVNTEYLYSYVFAANRTSGAELFLNGTPQGAADTTISIGTAPTKVATIGNHPGETTLGLHGDLMELMVFDAALSADDIRQVTSYLTDKYKIRAN